MDTVGAVILSSAPCLFLGFLSVSGLSPLWLDPDVLGDPGSHPVKLALGAQEDCLEQSLLCLLVGPRVRRLST